MHIKLISPTSYDLNNELIKVRRASLPPLSVMYIAALTPPEHRVSIIDESVQDIDFDEPADLVGISTMTFTAKRAHFIADEYRRRGVKVIMGGIHASSEIEETIEHADAVVIGEAEDIWQTVLRDAENDRLKQTYSNEEKCSLDKLPHPRFDLIDESKYVTLPFRRSPIMPIQTTRGCPFSCEFCTVSKFWGKKIRYRPISDVIEEVVQSKADTVFFTDDNFLADPQRTLELCKELSKLKIKYMCQIDSLAHRHKEVLKTLRQSGCFLAFVGFESLKRDNLKVVNKDFNRPGDYAQLIQSLHHNKINVYASIIFGFENDNLETVESTVTFLKNQKVGLASFFRLTPYPDTRLYERLSKQGVLTDKKWWLKRGEGLGSVIRYPDNPYSGEDLTSFGMKRFYSCGSILRRFFPFKPFTLDVLIFNLNAFKKLRKYKKVTVL